MNNRIRYIGNLFIGTLLVCIATPLTVSSSDGAVSIMELPPTTLGFLFFFMGFLRAEERKKKKISSIAFFMIIISAVSWSFNMDNALSLRSVLLNGVRITGLLYLLHKVVYFAEEIDRNISDDTGVDWLSLEWKIFGDRRKFCVIDEPRQYENLRLSQE